jgi:hypothetical protein
MRNLLTIIPAAVLACTIGSCTNANDASLHITWTLDGASATLDECNDAGASWVQIHIDDDGDGDADRYSRDMGCLNGSGETLKIFDSEESYQIKFELKGGGAAIAWDPDGGGWHSFDPEPGTNEWDVDFTIPAP